MYRLYRIMVIIFLETAFCLSALAARPPGIDTLFLKLSRTTESKDRIYIYNKISYLFISFDNDSAEYYAGKIIELAEQSGYKKGYVFAYNNMAIINSNTGKLYESINYYHKALAILDELRDSSDIAVENLNMAEIYTQIKECDLAIKYLKSSLEYSKNLRDTFMIARCYTNIGRNYYLLGNIQKAEESYENSMKYFEESKDRIGIAVSKTSLAICYIDKSMYEKAYLYLKSAIDILSAVDEPVFLLIAQYHLGDLFYKTGKPDSALKYLRISLESAKKSGFMSYELSNYKLISMVYEKTGMADSAYYYLKMHDTFEDSIYNADVKNKINFIKSKYEDEKKNKEIAEYKNDSNRKMFYVIMLVIVLVFLGLISVIVYKRFRFSRKVNRILEEKNLQIENQNLELERLLFELTENNFIIRNQNRELENVNRELSESNQTKDKFLSILAHDLFNPLQGLLLTNETINRFAENREYEKIITRIHRNNSNIRNINTLINNLLTWSRAQSGRIEPVPAIFSIQEIIEKAVRIHNEEIQNKHILINYNLQCFHAYGDANMIETVIRNLVSNAIKFSYENGEILIESNKLNENAEISIKDNGTGMTPDEIQSLFTFSKNSSKTGTKNETGTGLGLLICKEFINLNKGRIEVESISGNGSNFRIILPASH